MSRSIFITAALALAVTLPAVSAQAQAPRTFVSAAGSDSNPCSFAAPCRHFQAAVNVTSAGGEVDALDPAGYGPITISQAITIEGQGWSYIAPSPGGNGITINAVSGKVSIHGVSLNGVGIPGTTTGIQFNSGDTLNVQDKRNPRISVTSVSKSSPQFEPDSCIFVSNTQVSDNGGDGINFTTGGTKTTTGVISHVEMANNVGNGLTVTNASGPVSSINVTVSGSVCTDNAADGIAATPTGGATMQIHGGRNLDNRQ